MDVLIVEDDFDQAIEIKEFLRSIDANCEVAQSVKDAMANILRSSFDLIVLDLFLPDGNTASLSDFIRIRHPSTPILFITGSKVMPQGDHVDVLSTDYLLRKPLKEKEFTAIAEYLYQSSGRVKWLGLHPNAGNLS